MSWNNQGGGQGPWGSRGPSGNGPQGGSPPPNVEDLFRIITRWINRLTARLGKPGGSDGMPVVLIILGIVLVLWLSSGIYRVLPDEEGVVLRFGAYTETTKAGLHYHLPIPIESVLLPKVTRVRRTDVGMALDPDNGDSSEVPEESLMLTGDENIVDINLSVFWVVSDAKAYLFNIRDPDASVKSATESAVREIVGRTPIASVLAEGRAKIENDTLMLLQKILDSYGAGVTVTQVQLQKADPPQPVIDAFRDVQRARTDGERMRNDAQAYANDVVPRARGDAQIIVQQAEAFRQQSIAQAEGDSQRFLQVYNAWKQAKDVTSERLYLETMEQVLKGANTIVLDRSAAGSGVLPYLPLGDLSKARAAPVIDTPAPAPPPAPTPTPSDNSAGNGDTGNAGGDQGNGQ
jgi:membrane protease subunit HflK